MRVDREDHICITPKALRTADHFLLSRYFDYQQVPFHKTVAALELVLKDVIAKLLQQEKIDCSAQWVSEATAEGEWREFDDGLILQKIRELRADSESDVHRTQARAVLERTPPKLVAETEWIGLRDLTTTNNFRLQRRLVREKKPTWASRFNIDEDLWYVWDTAGMTLTKVGSHVPISALKETGADDDDKYEQAIRVLDGTTNTSRPIMELNSSLMSILANHALYSLRVYVLFPEGVEEQRRAEISNTIKDDLPEIAWN